jgi:putative two-component system response regulator
MGERVQDARVMIVDDQMPTVLVLERMLRKVGYTNLQTATDPHLVLSLFAEFQPDILLLDLHMPGMNGFEVMEKLQGVIGNATYFPILVLTADVTAETKQRALACGAKDFLTKPFEVTEVLLRIKNLLETRFLHLQMQNQNQVLEIKVKERTRDLEQARIEILARLSLAAEFRDDDTGQHTQRVGHAAALLAKALGCGDDQVELIRRAAPLHDVGKIGIPDAILLKPGRLEPAEFRIMATHTTIGGKILSGSQSPLLQLAESIALTHHECWDGSGYPIGLKGEDVPIVGRIVAVADVFDALTHERPYKKAWPIGEAVAEIERLSGRKFDPRIVETFHRLRPQELLQVQDTITGGACAEAIKPSLN